MKGKLIIIEGIDGSGKATQTKLLVAALKKRGRKVETFSFPRHGQKFFGLLVDQYLNNEFGNAAKLDPHLASVLYACDRWEAKKMLNHWLARGKTVILDRYATSNMAHQASKIKNPAARNKFLDWLDAMEFQTFKIPRPDLVLYLDVNVATVINLMEKRNTEDKKYIKGKKDGHENNKKHLTSTAKIYRHLCEKYTYWTRINCMQKGSLMSMEKIHRIIYAKLL